MQVFVSEIPPGNSFQHLRVFLASAEGSKGSKESKLTDACLVLSFRGCGSSTALKDWKLEQAIADRLHNPPISATHKSSSDPLNFDLRTFKPKRGKHFSNERLGHLIIPDYDVGRSFLQSVTTNPLRVAGRRIEFKIDGKYQPD
jgi:hypothetical protein